MNCYYRKQAIGDKLRGVYDSLAKDPNSLANLDQVKSTIAITQIYK